MSGITVHPEVADALRRGLPVVALETAVLTTGLPRVPTRFAEGPELPGWSNDAPTNLQTMDRMRDAVRSRGALPAVVGVLDGALHIGLGDEAIARLAADESAGKASITTLAQCMTSGRPAGTTVSATLVACQHAGIRFFATGGIGGVHRDWTALPDVSADLAQLGRTPTCVVCSGAKSILDLPATLEALETLGVPIIGYRTDGFPQFYTGPLPGRRIDRLDTAAAVVRVCRTQWEVLGFSSGVLVTSPAPPTFLLGADELDPIVADAESAAADAGEIGIGRTPYLLGAVARATGGRSIATNIALLESNATLAAELAAGWAVAADA